MGILVAFVIALLLSLLFSSGYRKGDSLGSLGIFFMILFMVILAGQFWIGPYGPVLFGVAWLPLLSIGVICALLLATPPPRIKTKTTDAKVMEANPASTAINVFMWVLFCALLIALIAGYYK